MKHKHSELIKKWADGAEIQVKNPYNEWVDEQYPDWDLNLQYRIKPEPEPDIFKFVDVRLQYKDTGICRWDSCDSLYANLKLVFDGKTGKLKSAEVIK